MFDAQFAGDGQFHLLVLIFRIGGCHADDMADLVLLESGFNQVARNLAAAKDGSRYDGAPFLNDQPIAQDAFPEPDSADDADQPDGDPQAGAITETPNLR